MSSPCTHCIAVGDDKSVLGHSAEKLQDGSSTLAVLVATIDAQCGGMGDCRVGEVRAGTTSPMPDHKG